MSKTFKAARLTAVAGGALGVIFTALLLFFVLIPQWQDDPAFVILDTIIRQTVFIGIPTLTSILIIVYSWRARVETRRANGIAVLLSSIPLLLVGIVGFFGISIIFIYFFPGILATVAALVITFA